MSHEGLYPALRSEGARCFADWQRRQKNVDELREAAQGRNMLILCLRGV